MYSLHDGQLNFEDPRYRTTKAQTELIFAIFLCQFGNLGILLKRDINLYYVLFVLTYFLSYILDIYKDITNPIHQVFFFSRIKVTMEATMVKGQFWLLRAITELAT